MDETRVEFRRFDAIRIAVGDIEAAVSGWRDQLGWQPSVTSAGAATFPLDDARIQMSQAAPGQPSGVIAVAVTVDDVERAARRIAAAGFPVTRAACGAVVLPAGDLNGVTLELTQAPAGARPGSPGPYRRINHVVVAVEDDDAARQNWARAFGGWPPRSTGGREHFHHVPVGAAWFGLTAAGTDAGALRRFLERRGEGVYALGLTVDDWAPTVEGLRRNGARLLTTADQTFVHPGTTHGVLIEVMAERNGT